MLTVLWIVAVVVGLTGAGLRERFGPRLGRRRRGRARRRLVPAAGRTHAGSAARYSSRSRFRLRCRRCAASSSATACSRVYRKVMPPMSHTEREALEAGSVWWDGELFSGRPELDAPAGDAAALAHAEEQPLPRRGDRSAVRDEQRLGSRPTSTRTCRRTCGSSSRTRASSG